MTAGQQMLLSGGALIYAGTITIGVSGAYRGYSGANTLYGSKSGSFDPYGLALLTYYSASPGTYIETNSSFPGTGPILISFGSTAPVVIPYYGPQQWQLVGGGDVLNMGGQSGAVNVVIRQA